MDLTMWQVAEPSLWRIPPGGTVATRTPARGSDNLIMALAVVAQTASSAVFSITANVPTSQFRQRPVPRSRTATSRRLQQV
jgi:hypothetical protein